MAASQAAVTWDVGQLSRHFLMVSNNERAFQTGNLQELTGQLTDLAEQLERTGPQHKDMGAKLREVMKDMLGLNAEVGAHAEALDEMRLALQPTMAPTNFKAEIDVTVDDVQQKRGHDPEEDAALQEFDQKVAAINGGGAAADEDEDLQIADNGDITPNMACPITGISVWEIQDPVADVKGYVYEKADIVKHIQNEKRERGICICPVAMTQHQITVEGLKKAAHVIRAQKQKRRHAEKTSQNPESRSHRGDVLDID